MFPIKLNWSVSWTVIVRDPVIQMIFFLAWPGHMTSRVPLPRSAGRWSLWRSWFPMSQAWWSKGCWSSPFSRSPCTSPAQMSQILRQKCPTLNTDTGYFRCSPHLQRLTPEAEAWALFSPHWAALLTLWHVETPGLRAAENKGSS